MKTAIKIKSLIRGAATVLEIFPSHGGHYRRAYPHASDVDALRGDWEKVGKDIRKATKKTAARG
jgi:hypothetical protein